MNSRAEELSVHLVGNGHPPVRVGILSRDEVDNVQFIVDNAYLELGPKRPLLSVSWHVPGNESLTLERLRDRRDKMARFGQLPPWFGNLLPEGALRNLVEAQMPTGHVTDFDMIKRLGTDLPGAIVIGMADVPPVPSKPDVLSSPATAGLPRLKFSLAGVQLKFSSVREGGRLTLPAYGAPGRVIVKLPSEKYPDLPEIEFSSMKLAQAAGIDIAECDLLPSTAAEDIPERLRPGRYVLSVTRFDRTDKGGRVHIEDFNQVMEAIGDQKYVRANEESVVNAIRRFAIGGAAAVEQAIKRIVINILLGNTDAHLKNWSFIFPGGSRVDLAPAYDIVSIVLLDDDDTMALKLRGTKDPKLITVERFVKIAPYIGFTEAKMRKIVTDTAIRAADIWPETARGLPLAEKHKARLNAWWKTLPLAVNLPAPFL